jgi:hypothetical protein
LEQLFPDCGIEVEEHGLDADYFLELALHGNPASPVPAELVIAWLLSTWGDLRRYMRKHKQTNVARSVSAWWKRANEDDLELAQEYLDKRAATIQSARSVAEQLERELQAAARSNGSSSSESKITPDDVAGLIGGAWSGND